MNKILNQFSSLTGHRGQTSSHILYIHKNIFLCIWANLHKQLWNFTQLFLAILNILIPNWSLEIFYNPFPFCKSIVFDKQKVQGIKYKLLLEFFNRYLFHIYNFQKWYLLEFLSIFSIFMEYSNTNYAKNFIIKYRIGLHFF